MKKVKTLEKPEERERERRDLPVGGAGRGALLNLTAIEDFNRASTSFVVVPSFFDTVPGKADALARVAKERGIEAKGIEGRIEDVERSVSDEQAPMILNLDQPRSIAEVLKVTRATKRVTLIYLLLKLPSGALWGLRLVISPGEPEFRQAAIRLFERLGELTARRGSAQVVGEFGKAEHIAAEPLYRAWFARHTRENLSHIVADTTPDANPIEVTDDGQTTYPLFVSEGATWSEPEKLAHAFANDPPVAILKGESFVVAEITPAGLRLHKVRRRKTDGQVRLQGMSAIDEPPKTEPDPRPDLGEVEAAMGRAERETLSRTNPVLTTD